MEPIKMLVFKVTISKALVFFYYINSFQIRLHLGPRQIQEAQI